MELSYFCMNHIIYSIICSHVYTNVLPARSLCEHNIIRMFVRVTFDKLNTREIFPMSHGLFEQRFMWTTEATVDLVRYYPEIPYSFLSCSSRPTSPRMNYVPKKKKKNQNYQLI